jgi:hypothetical protein
MVTPLLAPARQSGGHAFVLLALVLGLVLGAGAVGLSWFLTVASGAEPMEGAAPRDAASACSALARVPDLSFPITGGDAAGLSRLSAAALLAESASAEDSRYRTLSDALRTAADTAESAAVTEQSFQQAISTARVACGQ